ncbi:MAG: indolepyruvate oxidoreductase subunit beta [Candidatus Tectomicrobia bacterium]|uniref:Indolepyruvate oxidoreductase subunit beta n=1 Tax=Tectimicrobiota bacterium TaxID=2528274 RepID=A0A933GL55_UNCTE|nr:indolepyruvate oxidoreductase subunit beta [Candidatus Tectomicrobia bacterium]
MVIKNILFVGVGGQGVLLASEILAEACLLSSFDVKKSEVHGMAQRGGIVSSHVRYGRKVFSPLIKKGEADFILAFEELEALRWVDFLRANGQMIVNRQKIVPPVSYTGKIKYPADPFEELRKMLPGSYGLEGLKIAGNLGNSRLVSVIFLGVLSTLLEISEDAWLQAMKKRLPSKLIDLNLLAFQEGQKAAKDVIV